VVKKVWDAHSGKKVWDAHSGRKIGYEHSGQRKILRRTQWAKIFRARTTRRRSIACREEEEEEEEEPRHAEGERLAEKMREKSLERLFDSFRPTLRRT
jgi:hypothetical protein